MKLSLNTDFTKLPRAVAIAAPGAAAEIGGRAVLPHDERHLRRRAIELADGGKVLVDLPGVSKDDIQVNIEGPRVSITAETKSQRETKDGERVLHSERYAASYARSFELPAEVTEEGAEAAFDNGVLKLGLPKRATVTSKRLAVK